MFKKIFFLAITSVILQTSCSDNFYQLMEDEEHHHMGVEATISPASGSSINARDTITITFSKAMNPDTLKLAGDLSSGTGEWTSATNANDTLTLSPNQAWIVGADKTLRVNCESDGGIVMDTLNAVYAVTYSITATPSLADASTITGTESIVITFDDPMDTTSVVISGSLINDDSANVTAVWSTASETNDTVTLTPANTIWPSEGADLTLTINGNSAYGPAMDELSLTYDVEYAVYVRTTSSSDTNPGTKSQPRATIQSAIGHADFLYTTAVVRVAGGTYQSNYDNSSARDNPVVNMIEGISLYGGYSDSFADRNSTTTLEDIASAGGVEGDPNRAVNCGTGITNNTVIDGFRIISGKLTWSAGIFIEGSPTIQNNNIDGRGQTDNPGTISIGIYINGNQASPVVQDNSIDAKWNNDFSSTDDKSYGIYNTSTSSVIIRRNYINGGEGMNTYGIFNYLCTDTKIFNNVILAGQGSNITRGINDRSSVSSKFYNNTIHSGAETLGVCIYIRSGAPVIANNILTNIIKGYGIFEYNAGSKPASVYNNDFYGLTYVYRDGTTPADISTITAMQIYLDNQSIPRGGNINLDPQFSGSGDGWHLSISNAVSSGGLDGSASGWGFSTDKDKVTRTGNGTTGWSIGAYEYD